MKSLFTLQSAASVFMMGGSLFMSSKSFAQALSGIYTINASLPVSNNNFTNFNDAISQMSLYGVSGPVTFNVDSALYTEQVIIPEIAGASGVNTITFNGNGAGIKSYLSNTNERAVLKLNGAGYVTINNFRITAVDTSVYGYGIQLINNADHNIIQNCIISVPLVNATTSNFAGIVLNSSATSIVTEGNADCDDNIIQNNIISGGNHGISLVANGSINMISENKVLNNTVLDFFNAGIYLDGNSNAIVNGNDISRPNRATGALFYGIQLNNTSYNTVISNNKIHDPFGGTTSYVNSGANGIYFVNVNAGAENGNACFNNIFYNVKAGSIVRGVWVSSSPNNKFINNTLSIDDNEYTGFGSTTGFEISNSNNLTIQNNIISLKRLGANGITRYGINIPSPLGSIISNNDVFMADGNTHYFGKYGNTNCSDVAQWASISGDNTSISFDPVFANPANGDLMPANMNLVAGVSTNVSRDILGYGRNVVPTMGAFEIEGLPLPIKMSLLKARLNAQSEPVLSWETYDEHNNKGFEIQRSNDAKEWYDVSFINTKGATGAAYEYNDGVILHAKTFYRLKQLDDQNNETFSNIVWLSSEWNRVENLSIYPNPASGLIHVQLQNKEISNAAFIILNTIGKVVRNGYLTKNNTDINIAGLANGNYFIQIKMDNKQYSLPITKQ